MAGRGIYLGAFYTGDPVAPRAEALAVEGGRIRAIGTRTHVEVTCGDFPRVTLPGPFAMPGIIDVHNHVLEGARAQLYEMQLGPQLSFGDILERVATAAKQPARTDWIVGGPFAIGNCPQMRTAAGRAALDAVSNGRPVLLRDLSLHARFANSAALARAGIDRATREIGVGRIAKDAAGEPTGLVFEHSANALEDAVPSLTPEEWRACARRSMALLNAAGITGFGLAIASGTTLGALNALDDAGEMSAWCAGYMTMEALLLATGRDVVGDRLVAARETYRSAHLYPGFAKFFMDGVPLQRTAAFLAPYDDPQDFGPEFRGDTAYETDDLARRIDVLDGAGIGVKIHAIGDRAIRDALDAIEHVRRNRPDGPHHTIAHLQFIDPADIPRLQDLNVGADLCPAMWFPQGNHAAFVAALGAARVERSWPIADVVRSGALAAIGSDWPAMAPTPNPWPGIQALVTRANAAGDTLGKHQAIDVATALHLSTARAAQMLGLQDVTGTLRENMSADFIVLDRDPFAVAPTAIGATNVLETWFAGVRVHVVQAS